MLQSLSVFARTLTLVRRDGGEPGRSGYVNHSPPLFRRCALSSSDVLESLFALSDLSAEQVAMQLSWSFLGLPGTMNATAFHLCHKNIAPFCV